jgi:tetratricopeptide (TPR) repeat protein
MMKRVLSLIVSTVITGQLLFAQSVDEGRKYLYYERYQSAKETFEKILAQNPNNIEATYWLGQTLLEDPNVRDSSLAKEVYQKALANNGNAPLLLVGMGQIELMEGKTSDARQRFETAIAATKGRDIQVLNAVGRANVYTKQGDAHYAIQKLQQATEVKKFNDPDTYLIMGDAYRKLIDGGNAVTSYNKALALNPTLAAAKHKIGKIYLTQNNPEYFLPAFEEAIFFDEKYAPTYYELFYYWYDKDVNKAAEYLEPYISNSDQGPSIEYLNTDFTYSKGDFAGARAKAKELIAKYGDKVNPRMYRMIAYTSDTLGDLDEAKQAMLTFLEKADEGTIRPTDYVELANINSKIPGFELEAFENFNQAIEMDTLADNKKKYAVQAAELAKKLGNRNSEAEWLGKAYQLEKNPGQLDLYNWAYAHYQAGNYEIADSLFCDVYTTQYPDAIYGYLWCARAKQAQDTTMENGYAVEAFKTLSEKAVTLEEGKFKNQAIFANFYLVQYYHDIAKEYDTAVYYLDKVLEIDPENADAIRIKEIISKTSLQQKQSSEGRARSESREPKGN